MDAVIFAELWKFEFIWWDLEQMFDFGREISGNLLIFAHVETSWFHLVPFVFEACREHTHIFVARCLIGVAANDSSALRSDDTYSNVRLVMLKY
jgi:hypothetical protein